MCLNSKILVSVVIPILLFQIIFTESKHKTRIKHGYSCDTTKAPYFVLVHIRGACGGALITYSWVLTCAHCLGIESQEGTITSAHDRPPELKQVRNVKEVYPYPDFNLEEYTKPSDADLRGDIAVILVDEPFLETVATRVVSLPAPGFTKQCNQVMVPGIGKTSSNEPNEDIFPEEKRPLLCVNVNMLDINFCKENFTRRNNAKYFDTRHIICTYGEGKRGPCPGDSGGPLVCDNVVIGTVMLGGDCDKRYLPTLYAMVESYLDFIDYHIKFTGISFKQSRTNDTSGQKPSANTTNQHVYTNGTSVSGKKASGKSAASIVRVPHWKLFIFTLLYLIVLYH